jgi:hypothetical protein
MVPYGMSSGRRRISTAIWKKMRIWCVAEYLLRELLRRWTGHGVVVPGKMIRPNP